MCVAGANGDHAIQNAKARQRHRRLRISFFHRSDLLFPSLHTRTVVIRDVGSLN